jgi:putative transposase
VFSISAKLTQKIEKNRYVDLVAFTLMPNHFHLIVYEKEESGISRYMQRVLNAYTKYFNTKYKKSGHLFQGPYQFTRVEDNNQLLHLSAYIFRNPRELKNWSGKESKYLWSSYQDHLYRNRWGALLKFQIISEQFKNSKEYGEFVKSNSAKTDNLPENLLLE